MTKPLTDILRDYRRGKAVDLGSRLLAEIVQAVDATGKKGSLTMKITIHPEEGGGSQKELDIEFKAQHPVESLPSAVFFSDGDGDLHRSDPAQPELFQDTETRGRG